MLELLTTVWGCIVAMARTGQTLPEVLFLASLTGLLLAFLCHKSAWLWNKKYHVKLIHYFFPVMAGLSGLATIVMFAGAPFLKQVALVEIAVWKQVIKTDTLWNDQVFNQAREQVFQLKDEHGAKLESTFTDPKMDPFPITTEKSRLTAASVFANAARNNFLEHHALLGMIMHLGAEIPADHIKADMDRLFRNTNKNYEASAAIELAANEMSKNLNAQSDRLTSLGRIFSLSFFVITQAVAFGFIGFVAYREIKNYV